eukprot:6187780-Pleurochrysis_carterae.AAC.3
MITTPVQELYHTSSTQTRSSIHQSLIPCRQRWACFNMITHNVLCPGIAKAFDPSTFVALQLRTRCSGCTVIDAAAAGNTATAPASAAWRAASFGGRSRVDVGCLRASMCWESERLGKFRPGGSMRLLPERHVDAHLHRLSS